MAREKNSDENREALTFFVLDLGLDIVDGITTLDFESDSLPGEGFHEDLHVCRRQGPELQTTEGVEEDGGRRRRGGRERQAEVARNYRRNPKGAPNPKNRFHTWTPKRFLLSYH